MHGRARAAAPRPSAWDGRTERRAFSCRSQARPPGNRGTFEVESLQLRGHWPGDLENVGKPQTARRSRPMHGRR
eukprot:7896921-Pyramimonas_sp.AAC.1